MRWFPALVSNHVVDLVNKYPPDQLPESLTGYIRDRTGYDYHHHAEVGLVERALRRRRCRRPVLHHRAARGARRRLIELRDAGVDQFNIYLMNGDEEAQLEAYGATIIPMLREALAAA